MAPTALPATTTVAPAPSAEMSDAEFAADPVPGNGTPSATPAAGAPWFSADFPASLPAYVHCYAARGLALVTIPPGSKGPRARGWQHTQPQSPEATVARFAKLSGWGCGAVLGNSHPALAVIDIDDLPAAVEWFQIHGIDLNARLATADIPRSEGRPERAKMWFVAPAGLSTRKVANGAVELRAGAVQDVLPPSVHPDTGHPYRWLRPPRGAEGFPQLPAAIEALWRAEQDPQRQAQLHATGHPAGRTPTPRQNTNRGREARWSALRQKICDRLGGAAGVLATYHIQVGPDGRALSPFRREQHPGLQVHADGRWTDYGGPGPAGTTDRQGNAAGDAIDLERWYRNLTLAETTVQLAHELGLSRPAAPPSGEVPDSEPPDYGDVPPPTDDDAGETGRPAITAGAADLAEVVDAAHAALLAANTPPTMLRYGGRPVTVEQIDNEAAIVPIDEHRMRGALARAAYWYTAGKNNERRDAYTPMAVAQVVLASGVPQLPPLRRMVYSPLLAPSGRIVDQPGYDAETATWVVPGVQLPAVAESPTATAVAAARDLLLEWVRDFPFVGDPDRANLLALALLPYVRALIDGPTPLHMIEKPTPGTGASLLLTVIAMVATGAPPAMMSEGRDEDEWRKRVTSPLERTPAFVVIDNLRRRLDSAALSSVLTSTRWEDRRLGHTENVRLEVSCAWVATGNNPAVSSEIARRIVCIRMDAKTEKPWERSAEAFLHPDLTRWTIAHRPQLLAAIFTLLRAWVAAGRPQGQVSIGSYESYCTVVGGILDTAGIPGFLANRSAFYDRADRETRHWGAFIAAWWTAKGSQPVGTRDLWELMSADGADVEPPFEVGSGSERSQRTRFGEGLAAAVDRRFTIEEAPGRPLVVRVEAAPPKKRLAQYALVLDQHPDGEADEVAADDPVMVF